MNRRTAGLLMAVVAVVTSLVVLLRIEKPRRYLQSRFERVRKALPEPQQIRQSARHMARRVSHLAGEARGTTEQAINRVKHTGGHLAEKARQLTTAGNLNGR